MTPTKTACLATILAALLSGTGAAPLPAQTDYYNTDAGRPLQIEDAHPVERRAFEIQAAPLRFERSGSGAYRWEIEPEVAYGIFPRTHVELGAHDLVGHRRIAHAHMRDVLHGQRGALFGTHDELPRMRTNDVCFE